MAVFSYTVDGCTITRAEALAIIRADGPRMWGRHPANQPGATRYRHIHVVCFDGICVKSYLPRPWSMFRTLRIRGPFYPIGS